MLSVLSVARLEMTHYRRSPRTRGTASPTRTDHHQTNIPRMLWGIGDTRRFTDPEASNETSPTVVVIGNDTRCEAPG